VQRAFAGGTGALHVARESAVARAGFDDDERVGLLRGAPAPIECARNARAEQRADFRARDEVAPTPARAVPGREEADCGLVQREVEESIERDRALAPDEARDGIGGRAG
jgi:hypothetical protein